MFIVNDEPISFEAYKATFSIASEKLKIGADMADVWRIREKPFTPGRSMEILAIGAANVDWQINRLYEGRMKRLAWLSSQQLTDDIIEKEFG